MEQNIFARRLGLLLRAIGRTDSGVAGLCMCTPVSISAVLVLERVFVLLLHLPAVDALRGDGEHKLQAIFKTLNQSIHIRKFALAQGSPSSAFFAARLARNSCRSRKRRVINSAVFIHKHTHTRTQSITIITRLSAVNIYARTIDVARLRRIAGPILHSII